MIETVIVIGFLILIFSVAMPVIMTLYMFVWELFEETEIYDLFMDLIDKRKEE